METERERRGREEGRERACTQAEDRQVKRSCGNERSEGGVALWSYPISGLNITLVTGSAS